MATDTSPQLRVPELGNGPLVGVFVALQAVVFAVLYLADQSTWYAYFIVASAMGTAYLVETDHPLLAATARILGVQTVAFASGAALATGVTLLLGEVGLPVQYLGYILVGTAGTVIAVEEGGFTVATATLGSVLTVALGLPLFMFVARQTPALVIEKALDPGVHRVLYLGVYGPLLAALLSLLLGVPLAHLLARGFSGQPLVESLVDLPLVVPHSVAGIIILFGFGKGGAFPQLSVLGTMVGMVLAMAFVSAPYAVNASREAFEAIDDRLEYASRIHGANEWETFRRVTGPLAVRGMITGGVLAWARAVSEFGAVAVVAYSVEFFYLPDARIVFDGIVPSIEGGEVTAQHAPVFVYNTYLQGGLEESGAVAFLLLAVSAVIFLIVRYLTDDSSAGGMP